MDDFLIVSVVPDNRVQLNVLRKPDDAFRTWRRRWSVPFLPVVIAPTDAEWARKELKLVELPFQKTIEWAAARFSRTALSSEWHREVVAHIGKQGAGVSADLLLSWQRAITAEGVVASKSD